MTADTSDNTDRFTIKLARILIRLSNGSASSPSGLMLSTEPVNFVEVDFMIELAEGNRNPVFAVRHVDSAATVSESEGALAT